jgi:hypothetical protein
VSRYRLRLRLSRRHSSCIQQRNPHYSTIFSLLQAAAPGFSHFLRQTPTGFFELSFVIFHVLVLFCFFFFLFASSIFPCLIASPIGGAFEWMPIFVHFCFQLTFLHTDVFVLLISLAALTLYVDVHDSNRTRDPARVRDVGVNVCDA